LEQVKLLHFVSASVFCALAEELSAQVVPKEDLVDVGPSGLLAHH
jgi:hypothetical protein